MKSLTRMIKIRIVFLGISLLLVGCGTTAPVEESFSASELPNQSPTMANTSVTSQHTPTINATQILTEGETPTSSIPRTGSQISTPIGDGEREQVLWLYETNNGCLLPCFWGITPGKTEWLTAEALFNEFDENIYQTSPNPATGAVGYEIDIDLPRGLFLYDETRIGVLVQDDVVTRINARMPTGDIQEQYLASYRLPRFLTDYGQPSQIWIETSAASREGELPFRMLLYYAELGVVAMYSDNAVVEDDMVVGCPQRNPARGITALSSEANLSLEEIINSNSFYNYSFLPLEEATDMDTMLFYEMFKDPTNSNCLKTPTEVWRSS